MHRKHFAQRPVGAAGATMIPLVLRARLTRLARHGGALRQGLTNAINSAPVNASLPAGVGLTSSRQ